MKRRVLSLIMCGLLVVPTVGCNANLTVGGKEVFNFSDNQMEQQAEPKQEYQYKQETPSYNEDEILAMLLTGEYTLTVDEVSYVYNMEEMLKALYENPQYAVEHYNGNQYLIQVSNGNNFVTFLVEEGEEAIVIVELYHNGEFFEDEDANSTLPYVIYEEIFNEEDGTLTKKQQVTKEEVKEQEKSSKKEEKIAKEGFYIGEDGCYHCNVCGAIPSKEEYNEGKCETCYFKGVEESYNEKYQYGTCIDCDVYLTKNQANSYGGRCPDCYAIYYGDYDTNMGNCERCGDRVDLDHTNEGWGYTHLCSACTGELQAEENAQDWTPWAG